jgi:hypothetical protein
MDLELMLNSCQNHVGVFQKSLSERVFTGLDVVVSGVQYCTDIDIFSAVII